MRTQKNCFDAEQTNQSLSITSDRRNNNFNILRLLLAILVLLSHSPELVDGNRHREILTSIFNTLSFGEMAVDGFFLLSGYLIVQSWENDPNLLSFIKKRVLRIYPAFIVASIISAFVVGPLGSNPAQYFDQFNPLEFIKGCVLLYVPIVPPVFEGQPYPSVNGSMWTIEYEFRCYLLVALFGICGLLKKPLLLLSSTVTVIILSLFPSFINANAFRFPAIIFGDLSHLIRLLAFFCSGGCFYIFNKNIRYKANWVYLAIVILIYCMYTIPSAQFALATFGAYILFWFAFSKFYFLKLFRSRTDISYGVYLYGWPIQKLMLWYFPAISPWVLFIITCILSCLCGFLSWHLIEHPFLRLKQNKLAYFKVLSASK